MDFEGSTEYGIFYGKVKAQEALDYGCARAFDKEQRVRIVTAYNKLKETPVCRQVAVKLCNDDIELPFGNR